MISEWFFCVSSLRFSASSSRQPKSECQTVEKLSSGSELAAGTIELSPLDHVHGFDACDDDPRTPKWHIDW